MIRNEINPFEEEERLVKKPKPLDSPRLRSPLGKLEATSSSTERSGRVFGEQHNKKLEQGQSLLEMVFAVGILLVVVSAILALAISSLTGQKESELRIIANNLAREGIEVVRNIRDANWLANEEWDLNLKGSAILDPSSNETIAKFDTANNSWQLALPLDDSLYIDQGVYNHDSGQPSIFERRLALYNICQNITTGEENIKETVGDLDCDTITERKVGIKIIAQVSWEERDREHEVALEDLIYDWK